MYCFSVSICALQSHYHCLKISLCIYCKSSCNMKNRDPYKVVNKLFLARGMTLTISIAIACSFTSNFNPYF